MAKKAAFQSFAVTETECVSRQILSSECFSVFLTACAAQFVVCHHLYSQFRRNRLLTHSEVTQTCKPEALRISSSPAQHTDSNIF